MQEEGAMVGDGGREDLAALEVRQQGGGGIDAIYARGCSATEVGVRAAVRVEATEGVMQLGAQLAKQLRRALIWMAPSSACILVLLRRGGGGCMLLPRLTEPVKGNTGSEVPVPSNQKVPPSGCERGHVLLEKSPLPSGITAREVDTAEREGVPSPR